MRIVTWNINSVRLRIASLARLAKESDAEVICLQETKCPDEKFPVQAVSEMGYPHQAIRGMKSYNGVAILSRLPLADTNSRDWCNRQDCRHVTATLPSGIELHNFYVPSGGDVPDPDSNDKFAHKLKFLTEVAQWWCGISNPHAKRIMVGDFNVAPLETDVWSHNQLLDVVSHTPIEVQHLDAVRTAHDWCDAVRNFVPATEKLYSWWSYRARDWRVSNRGRRLDHIWVTPPLQKKLTGAKILQDVRDWPKPSDHAPIIVELKT